MTKPTANDIDQQLGLRLKKCRQMAGLSAAALAEATGSTQQQISRYENGQNKISAAQLYLIAKQLGVPVSWFFLNVDIPEKPDADNEVRETPPRYLPDNQDTYSILVGNAPIDDEKPTYTNAINEILAIHSLVDDTATLRVLWPRLDSTQRNALLRLLDTLAA